MKKWLPYILIPACVALLWWTPWVQNRLHRSVEVAIVERFEARQKLVPGPHEHSMDQEWFPSDVVPETLFVDRGNNWVIRGGDDTLRVPLEPLADATDDHAHFGVNDSSGVIYEVTSFMDWLLDTDRINALGMLVLVVGTALSKVVAMMVKAIRGKAA